MPRGPDQPPPKREKPQRTAAQILAEAQGTLETAEFGLRDFVSDDASRRMPGLRNVAVFGRAVTNVLQNLKSVDPQFKDWYAAKQSEMEADELLKFFYDLRSVILKEGLREDLHVSVSVRNMSSDDMVQLMINPPPGAKSFFIGDRIGGSGWEVELADGSIEKYYVALPDDLAVEINLYFPEPPRTHRGERLADTSIAALMRHYIDYLRGLVSEAQATFNPS